MSRRDEEIRRLRRLRRRGPGLRVVPDEVAEDLDGDGDPREIRIALIHVRGMDWQWGAERVDTGPAWAAGGGIEAKDHRGALRELAGRLQRLANVPGPPPGMEGAAFMGWEDVDVDVDEDLDR